MDDPSVYLSIYKGCEKEEARDIEIQASQALEATLTQHKRYIGRGKTNIGLPARFLAVHDEE